MSVQMKSVIVCVLAVCALALSAVSPSGIPSSPATAQAASGKWCYTGTGFKNGVIDWVSICYKNRSACQRAIKKDKAPKLSGCRPRKR